MIKSKIRAKYLHQYNSIKNFSDNIFVADYTESTKSQSIKRSVEFFSPDAPSDIEYFSIINNQNLNIDAIDFNNFSFVDLNGKPKSQCEAVLFPSVSNSNSWILFCELKYSLKPLNNNNNLKKAIRQLYKTHYYYIQDCVISISNNCYLIASLPMQQEPFTNFSLSPALLTKLKSTRNIVLRLTNSVEIFNNSTIHV